MTHSQYSFIEHLHKLQPSIDGKDFRVCKRDKDNKPTEQKPFHQVTELYFPVDDCDLPYSVIAFDFDGDGSYTDENKAQGHAVTNKLTSWLKWKTIPHHVFDHSGRSPHTWILFKLPDSALGGPDKNKIYHSERMRISTWILKEAGINEKESGFDKKIFASSRHIIRAPKKDLPKKIQTWEITDAEYKAILGKSQEDGRKKNDEPLKNEMYLRLSKAGYYFRDQHNEVFAAVEVNGHREIYPTDDRWFRSFAARLIYTTLGEVAGADALRSVISLVEADAFHDGQRIKLSNRAAFHEGALWYDLCNDKWQVVRIDADGWQVVDDSPILFRRYNHQQAQVYPDAEAGNVKLYLEHTNLKTDEDKIMALASLCYGFVPDKDSPMVYPYGTHGAAKSTFCSMNKALIDPSSAEKINLRKKDDWAQNFEHHFIPVLDNVSHIDDDLSDFLCQVCTGVSGSKRALFTNNGDILHSYTRQIYINGISMVAHKPDLLDRILPLELEAIKKSDRKEKEKFWFDFNRDKPQILGGVFTALSKAIKSVNELKLSQLQRMADFTRWGEAISRALGYPDYAFLEAYQGKVDDSISAAFESNPIAGLLMSFIESDEQKEKPEWVGTMTQLHSTLRGYVMKEGAKEASDLIRKEILKDFPKNPSRLAVALGEIRNELLGAGIQIDHSKGTAPKWEKLIHIKILPSLVSVPSSEVAVMQLDEDTTEDGRNSVPSSYVPKNGTEDREDRARTVDIVIPSDRKANAATAKGHKDAKDGKLPTVTHIEKKIKVRDQILDLVNLNDLQGENTLKEDLIKLGASDSLLNELRTKGYLYENPQGRFRPGGCI